MDEKRNLSKMDMPLYGGFVCTIAAFLLNLLAFSSPYWLESYAEANNPFTRMGIWEVCFDGFIHPQDSRANVWRGCFWMFDRRFFDTKLWYYLDPPWLIAVEVLSVLAFILHIIAVITVVLYFLYLGQPAAESIIAWICNLVGGVFMFIVICIFGHFVEDRAWMPRPDHNHLSWSYAFAVLGCVMAFASCAFLTCVARSDRRLQRELEYMDRYADRMPEGPPAGSTRPYSRGPTLASVPPSGHGMMLKPGAGSVAGASAVSGSHQFNTGHSTVHVPFGPASSVA